MPRMASLIALLLALPLAASQPADVAAALADQAKLPPDAIPFTHYLTLAGAAPEDQVDLGVATRLVVASSSRQPIIERCTPQYLDGGVLRIDLRDLLWDYKDFAKVMADYPYQPWTRNPPLVIRADWLLLELADQQESDAFEILFYGSQNIPKTRDDALKFLSVDTVGGTDTDDYRNFGMIEGKSGVAVNGIRWIENRPVQRGYAWGTRDILQVEQGKDPLENLTGGFNHDGEEWIIGIPKQSLRSNKRGALQVYFLANGAGTIVNRAPVDLVVDATRFRGVTEIRAAGSCVQCHSRGLNDPTSNELRVFLDSGAQIQALKELPTQIEAFHLAELRTEIERDQQDYATAVDAVCGVEPTEAAAAFKRSIDAYDKPLNLTTMARELRRSEDALRNALAFASANGIPLSARLAGAATGITVPREAWEAAAFIEAQEYLRTWEN